MDDRGAGLFVITGSVYFQVCGHDFVQFDDPDYVTDLPWMPWNYRDMLAEYSAARHN